MHCHFSNVSGQTALFTGILKKHSSIYIALLKYSLDNVLHMQCGKGGNIQIDRQTRLLLDPLDPFEPY